jgi:concentrative nucleoside transporter, CNT family
MLEGWIGIVGILTFLGLVYAASSDRRSIRWRPVAWGLGLQIVMAVLVLRIGAVRDVFRTFADGVRWTVSFSDRGAETLFGWLARTEIPVVSGDSGSAVGVARVGAVVLLQILPTLIFVSSLMSVLYHFGILQRVVGAMAWLMQRTMRVSGAEALAAASNVFLGMTEAPLLVRPYLPAMTPSELMAVMVAGFATISSSMMAVYARFGVGFDQMLVASIISAPAALYLTKIALPETGTPRTLKPVKVEARETVNFIDAAAGGAATGLQLALNVGAMLLAFAAGLALIDASLGALGGWLAVPGGLSLGRILGWLFWPVAWLMGVPAAEAGEVGRLLGIKIAVNEYFAYDAMTRTALSERSRIIAAFALCGFANFGSIAIQVGGIGGLIPERRRELARFGIRAMLLGALATIISGTLAGIIVPVP